MKPSHLEVPLSTAVHNVSSPADTNANVASSSVTPRTIIDTSPEAPSGLEKGEPSVHSNATSCKPEPPLPNRPVKGWPQLAALMDKNPYFAAFPRYRELNIKSLLYYQAQLTILRRKLYEQEWHDAGIGEEWAEYADDLVESNSEQFQTLTEIRKVLKEYNEALLQFSQICALPDPEPFHMRTLREWLRNEKGADFTVCGRDGLESLWGDVYKDPDQSLWLLLGLQSLPGNGRDLALTTPATKIDGLTRWIATVLYPFGRAVLQRLKPKRQKKDEAKDEETQSEIASEPLPWDHDGKIVSFVRWSEKGVLKATTTLSIIVACLLPVIAISILSQVHGLKNLLGCLAGFTSLFAMALIFLAQGTSSPTEIFAATAAFSAVMVVFISQPPAPVINVAPGAAIPSITPSPSPLS